MRRAALPAIALLFVLVACGGSGGEDAAAGSPVQDAPERAAAERHHDGALAAPAEGEDGCAGSGSSVLLAAKDARFDTDCIAVDAGLPFVITFVNGDEGVPHNVHIFSADPHLEPEARSLFAGERIVGLTQAEYRVDALEAGTYHFHCDVHPDSMTGVLVVRGEGAASRQGG